MTKTKTKNKNKNKNKNKTNEIGRLEHNCSRYDGVLLIDLAPRLAATGTVFFQFTINHILYAEKNQLLPFVHFSPFLVNIYDPEVHGNGSGVRLELLDSVVAPWITDEDGRRYAGPPVLANNKNLTPHMFERKGTGVWNHYLEPLLPLSLLNDCAKSWPLVTLELRQINEGFSVDCPWAVRAWRYRNLHPTLMHRNLTDKQWHLPMRRTGQRVVSQYFRLLPHIQKHVEQIVPPSAPQCLSLHVRHSDKKAGRRIIGVDQFWPYVQAYLEEGGRDVFLATDSVQVVETLQTTYNATNLYYQTGIVRSSDNRAVFKLSNSHHQTNTEALIDIYGLSRCDFLLHGQSALSEAAMYLNGNLHMDQSVDMEESSGRVSVDDFRRVVKRVLNYTKL